MYTHTDTSIDRRIKLVLHYTISETIILYNTLVAKL